jgi:hypothetical protein
LDTVSADKEASPANLVRSGARRAVIAGPFLKILVCAWIVLCSGIGAGFAAGEGEAPRSDILPPLEIHGFVETRAGCRISEDSEEKDVSIMETRLQAEVFTWTDWADFKYKGDVWADGVTEQGEYETREAWMFARPSDVLDIKIGRQVLTWGTGDLVFLNDLFPKDWQSYFIGRDKEYLKAPSDAVKVGLFSDMVGLDLVYTPKFDPDRFITGEYVSYWNGDGFSGRDDLAATNTPDKWFRDDELALRVYTTIHNYELAAYGYRGFWKRPAGLNAQGEGIFPGLDVVGASARGQVGPGIGNVEFAYYHSKDDPGGRDPDIDNSEARYLVGYTQDVARDLNVSLQYYVEQMAHYHRYRDGLKSEPGRDRFRQIVTLQVTWLLLHQNLELVFSGYISPTDKDTYLRPTMRYKYSDQVILEAGLSMFLGEEDHTFFGQFENNSNVFGAVRYSF